MQLNTRWLFCRLLGTLGIDTVCDIGSMDGADSLAFRAAVPAAQIFAFEAHPENFRLMAANAALQDRRIVLAPLALTDRDGESDFFVVPPGYAPGTEWRGMSSLGQRSWQTDQLIRVRVNTARLDTYLQHNQILPRRLALWIDVEGQSFQVLEGAARSLAAVHLLHVEVESSPLISPEQRCYADVAAQLTAAGFVELAVDRPAPRPQFNALFVRKNLSPGIRLRVALWTVIARLRRLLATAARAVT